MWSIAPGPGFLVEMDPKDELRITKLVQIRMNRLRQLRLEEDAKTGARGDFEGNYAELERVRAELPVT